MLYISIKNILSNKIRYILTGLTITLGVCFVVVSFGLSDSIRQSFSGSLDQEFEGIDLAVLPTEDKEDDTISAEQLATIEQTAGVDSAEGEVSVFGERVTSASDETLLDEADAMIWVGDSDFNRTVIVDGKEPGADEFLLDTGLATTLELSIGDTVNFETEDGAFLLTLSGLVEEQQTDGSTEPVETFDGDLYGNLFLDGETVRKLAEIGPNTYTLVWVATDGETPLTDVQTAVADALGNDIEVENIQDLKDEIQAEIDGAVNVFQRVLLGFAFISMAVAAFIIYNTFAMLLTQRMREIGLLRAIGAGSRQLRTSVIAEAALVGLVAALFGIVFGRLLLSGLISLVAGGLGAGSDLPVVMTARTVVAAVVSGIGITIVAALVPAIRAGMVSPVVAMSGLATKASSVSKLRIVLGAIVFGAGVAAGSYGLFGSSETSATISTMALGAAGVFAGTVLISPALAIGVTKLLSYPAGKVFGLSGQLAAESAGRSPKRTATTSAALMIGLALITTTLVVGESVKNQVSTTIESRIQADFAVFADGPQLDPTMIANIRDLDESGIVMTAAQWEFADYEFDGNLEEVDIEPVEMANLEQVFDLDLASGSIPSEGGPSVVVPKRQADRYGLAVGDEVELALFGDAPDTPTTVTVAGVYQDILIFQGWVIDTEYLQTVEPGYEPKTDWLALTMADGSTPDDARAALLSTIGEDATIDDRASFNDQVGAEIDTLLAVVSALLLLSVLIAFIGIGLTLALSVFERTREFGLLRAVGMSRRQMRRLVRVEAMIIALFGAMLGVGVGLLFGSGAVRALPEQIASTVSLPVGRLTILTCGAAVVGLVAAILPARRAARLDILDAISVE